MHVIQLMERGPDELRAKIDETVGVTGWTDTLAQHILQALQMTLMEGRERMGPALTHCYDNAVGAAQQEFDHLCRLAKDHPGQTVAAVFLTILALGVLVELLLLVVELLGFGELGPVEGRQSGLSVPFQELIDRLRFFCVMVGVDVPGLHTPGLALLLLPEVGHDLGSRLGDATSVLRFSS
ncbi:hypothetical protein CDD83_7604 [Cordyceps sp. RAO-2017]|nr:hypothetical protein CDD83_7604 [Cordyceps sp. RAO-2017]